ncbi:unnamed protein product [Zymoseptoria tritici ST99CH_3D1]|nr:unnamed protein product [Zymoseptoria tritici ST99CH_3D1]
MGLLSSLVNAFRKSRRDGHDELDSSRHERAAQGRHRGNDAGRGVDIEMGRAGEQIFESGRSQRQSLSRTKSLRGSNKRRSWFGGRADADDDIPAVPAIARNQQANGNGQPRHVQIQTGYEFRGSWFSNNRQQDAGAVADLPTLPAMPVTVVHSTQPATAALPTGQQRARRASMKSQYSVARSTRSKSKSNSFWASSNPDDSDAENVPPVPALVRDDDNSPDESFESFRHDAARGRSGKPAGAKGTRPVSTTSRKSYRPKSAASGFLKSTNGATESQRRSYRNSFKLVDGSDMVCLTDDQRVAWAQLMNEGAVFDDKDDEDGKVEVSQPKDRHSNAEALAALEFGSPR